jgi:hypothetical protein
LQQAHGQIYVDNFNPGIIAEYGLDGTPINTSLITTGVGEFTVYGSTIYATGGPGAEEYTISGTPINIFLITVNAGYGIVTDGSDLFVADAGGNRVGEYTTSGTTVTRSLVTGLSNPLSIALSGSDLFVASYASGVVGEYTTAGATVNAALITGLSGPRGVTVSGNDVYIVNESTGTIGEYTLGATPGTIASSIPALVTGLVAPGEVAVFGSDLYVTNGGDIGSTPGFGTIGEYTTSGAPVNPNLVTGLSGPTAIVVLPEPASGSLFLIAGMVLLMRRRRP